MNLTENAKPMRCENQNNKKKVFFFLCTIFLVKKENLFISHTSNGK